MEPLQELQQRICRTYGAGFEPPAPGSKVGLAIPTLDRIPIHGVRLAPTDTTCGWYIYAGGEWSDAADFYQPLCVEHMADYCRLAVPFLGLPPGWRFMIDGQGFIDVWQDAEPGAPADTAV
ncbi:hypothetical protein GobsT_48100 [Gemmata obscuriglobus]|uniref:immunity protein Imm33 domain-containing protein n=1 Tax=Gemmata obscuriglobus TaxID=114 RepID=UPI00016C3818|nr:hypothetical protein [Gemmata obscuriglobus]QEG30010.1 hypothetical protein GobsT_48100 [Gemmata obscuriglobus]VTS09331.1 Uncharacterized protein OS=Vibrio sp. OY15 GN=IJ23_05455 PE=4 SV=1 [Gemmata obscuriglobus UQM 2246]